MPGEFRLDQVTVPEQQKLGIGMPGQRDRRTGNDNRSADIATHGVKRDSNLLRHERPGNLLCCGTKRISAAPNDAAIGGARPEATPGGRRQ
jgi:hypothetical protein